MTHSRHTTCQTGRRASSLVLAGVRRHGQDGETKLFRVTLHELSDRLDSIPQEGVFRGGPMVDGPILAAVHLVEVPILLHKRDKVGLHIHGDRALALLRRGPMLFLGLPNNNPATGWDIKSDGHGAEKQKTNSPILSATRTSSSSSSAMARSRGVMSLVRLKNRWK